MPRGRRRDAPCPRQEPATLALDAHDRALAGIVRPVVLLAIMLALVVAARSFTIGAGGEVQSGATLGAGLALVGGLFAGQIFAALKPPRITGYLSMGMAVGPSGFELINARTLGDLSSSAASRSRSSRCRPGSGSTSAN